MTTKSPEKNLVLALDDKWGNGKTSFVKMMESEIKLNHKEELDVIYFDAFENDYQSDPFIALSAKIYSLLEDDKTQLTKFGETLLNVSKKLAASFLINGSKLAITALTAGVVNSSALEKAGDSIAESISSPLEDFIKEKIQSAKEETYNIENFKKVLEQIHTDSNKRTLFIIDELDRARPDFALDLLEKIKHLFSVKGIIFLLVMNKEQFEKSIECRYGRIDSSLYLNKFINYWFSLPKIKQVGMPPQYSYSTSTIMKYLLELNGQNRVFTNGGTIIKTLAYLIEVNGCSLREAERCYSVMVSIEDHEKANQYGVDALQAAFALAIFLKVYNKEAFTVLLEKNTTPDEFLKIINIRIKDESNETFNLYRAITYHLLTDEQLKIARDNSEFRDIEFISSRKVEIFKICNEALENLSI